MNNVTMTVKGGKLVIEVDVGEVSLANAKPSASGKTRIVASTEGNQPVLLPDGTRLRVGLNAYVK